MLKNNGYTIIQNAVFHDRRLSYKAKGIYCQLVSLPDNWKYSKSGLVSLSDGGMDAITSGLNELKKYGYITIIPSRNDKGQIEYEYKIEKNPPEPP